MIRRWANWGIISNTMLFQVAVRAWLFPDERMTGRQVASMVLAALHTLAVQIRRRQRRCDDRCGLFVHPQVRFSLGAPSVTVCPLALDSRAASRIAITSRARWAVIAGGRPLDIASARSS